MVGMAQTLMIEPNLDKTCLIEILGRRNLPNGGEYLGLMKEKELTPKEWSKSGPKKSQLFMTASTYYACFDWAHMWMLIVLLFKFEISVLQNGNTAKPFVRTGEGALVNKIVKQSHLFLPFARDQCYMINIFRLFTLCLFIVIQCVLPR